MKAVYFDGKEARFVEDYPEPAGRNEAFVRVRLAGICGTDIQLVRGYASFRGVPGHEFVGEVEESDDESLVGQRVVGEINVGCGGCEMCRRGLERHCPQRTVLGIHGRDGAFAQYLTLPTKNLHIIPDNISDEEGVMIEPLAAAFEILEQVHINPVWRIAVIGDGRMGQIISRTLALNYPNVKCFGKHGRKLELLEKQGIETSLSIEPADLGRYDVVVEATGSPTGIDDALKIVKPRGIIVMKTTIAEQYKIDMTPIVVNEITIIGSRCGRFQPAIYALAKEKITLRDIIDGTYPLEEFREAFKQADTPGKLKILLKP